MTAGTVGALGSGCLCSGHAGAEGSGRLVRVVTAGFSTGSREWLCSADFFVCIQTSANSVHARCNRCPGQTLIGSSIATSDAASVLPRK